MSLQDVEELKANLYSYKEQLQQVSGACLDAIG